MICRSILAFGFFAFVFNTCAAQTTGTPLPSAPHCGTSSCLQGFCSAYYGLNAISSNGTCASIYNTRYCQFCQSCVADSFPIYANVCDSTFAYFCSFIPPNGCYGRCNSNTCDYCQDIRSQCTLPSNPLPEICVSPASPVSQFCNSLRNNPICNFPAGTPYCEFCTFYEDTCNNLNFTDIIFPHQLCDNPLLHSGCAIITNRSDCSSVYSEGFCQFCDMVAARCPANTNPPSFNDACNSTLRTFCETFSVSSSVCGAGNTQSECSICRLVNVACPSNIAFFDTCSDASSYLCQAAVRECQISPELCTVCKNYLQSCSNVTGSLTGFCFSEISQVCSSFPTGSSCQALVSNVSSQLSVFCSLCDLYVKDCGMAACNNTELIRMCEANIGNLTQRQILSPRQCSPCSLAIGLPGCFGVRVTSNNTSALGFLLSALPDPQECRKSPCLQSFCSPMVILRYTNVPCTNVYDPAYCAFCDSCENFPTGGNRTLSPMCMTPMALSCAVTSRYLPCFLLYGSDYCTSCIDVLNQCPGLVFPENFFPMQVCDQPFLLSGCSVLSSDPSCSSVYGEDACRFCNMTASRCPPLTKLPSLADLCFNATFRGFCQGLSVPFPACNNVYTNPDCSFCQLLDSVCPSTINLPTNILDSCTQASVYLCSSVVQSGCDISSELCTACQYYLQLCSNITGNRTSFCFSETSTICGHVPAGPACRSLTGAANATGLSTVCDLCDFYVKDCGEITCNDSNLVEMCNNATGGLLPPDQCSPCSLILGLCPVLRSSVGNATTINSSIAVLRTLAPTREECENSPCLLSLCSPITYLSQSNVPCADVYQPDYCTFCDSCLGNNTVDPLCASPVVSSCALTTANLPCNSLFGAPYCDYCNSIISRCPNVNVTNTTFPTEVCNNPVLRSVCAVLTANTNCSNVYSEQVCAFCDSLDTQCPPNMTMSLLDLCSNQTFRSVCRSLVSTSLPYCGAASPTQDCAICQELEFVCPSNISIILANLDTCSQASSYLCTSVLDSDCEVLTPQLCLACQGYLQMCADITPSREEFCFSEVSTLCGSIPTGPACRGLVSSATPGLSVVCSMCELYVRDCGEMLCDDSDLIEMCYNSTRNIEQETLYPPNQCGPCSLLIGICPVLRSAGVVNASVNASTAAAQSLAPTAEQCRSSPCLLTICSPLSYLPHINIACEEVYSPEYCIFCQSCQRNSSSADPLCSSSVASSCALTTTSLPCSSLFGDDYCNFCNGIITLCPNLNYSSGSLLPAAVCDNPVLRSTCSVLTSNSNCSGLYTEQVCALCTTVQSQCSANGSLPTIDDLCSNHTIRSICRTLVSSSLLHCAAEYPEQDCSLCQALNSICPANLSSILSHLDTCSQASSYLCRSILESDCNVYTNELCMVCQGYLQSCGNISGSQEQFCFSEASQICSGVPSGPACQLLANLTSPGLSVFCSLCDFYAEDCGPVVCNQSSFIDSCFNAIGNTSNQLTTSPQICSPCNLVVGVCTRIQPNLEHTPAFPQSLTPTPQECLSSPCLQSFCLPTTFSRQFNLACNETYNEDYCAFCEACYGSNSAGNGTDPRCTSPIASSCSITARYFPCYATFGAEYCDSCKELLNLCPNFEYPDNVFPTQVCGQPLLLSSCAVLSENPNCTNQYSEDSCEFCREVKDICPPVTTTPPISELCANETVRDFCQTISISFPQCAKLYTNTDCSLCQLLNSVCPSNITIFDTCVSESVYLCRSIVQDGCDLSSELCTACTYYLQMCPSTPSKRNQFCQSNITYACGSIPTGVACQALSVTVPQIKIFCSICQFYVEDCGQFACGDQELVNFCFNTINDLNSRQMLTSQQCSPCNLIIGLCPPSSINSSLSLPDTMAPTPQECASSPCLQSFCTPVVITHQVNSSCENFYNPSYCSFCESCLGISGSGISPSCQSPLASSCAISGRYLPCFTLFGNDYCNNCLDLIKKCPNLDLPASFFPQEVCGQPLLHTACNPLNRSSDCTSVYTPEACQFCSFVSGQCPPGVTYPSISDLCFNTTIRGICQALSISFPLCAQVYTNADCSLCQLINTQCPTLPLPGGNCTDDYAGLFCRLVGQDTTGCLARFTPETCQACSIVAKRCGVLETTNLNQNQLVTLCALRTACSFFPLNCGHQSEFLCDYCNFLRSNQGELTCPTGLIPTVSLPQPPSTSAGTTTVAPTTRPTQPVSAKQLMFTFHLFTLLHFSSSLASELLI